MAAPYRYSLDCSVVEYVLGLPARQREQFATLFRRLANDPFQKGETSFHDYTGREIQQKLLGEWLVSFWPDHPVKEVRIVGVQRIKRK